MAVAQPLLLHLSMLAKLILPPRQAIPSITPVAVPEKVVLISPAIWLISLILMRLIHPALLQI